MRFTITCAKISGQPSSSGWAQVHDFTPSDAEKLSKRGRLVAVLGIKLDSALPFAIEIVGLGREILTRLHEEYFGNLEKDAFETLRGAVAKVESEFSDNGVRLELSTLAIIGEKVVFAGIGGGALVLRQGVLARLVSPSGKLSFGSGVIKESDSYLLGTSNFFAGLTEGVIKATLELTSVEKAMENIRLKALSAKGSEEVAAAVLRVENSKQEFAIPTPEETTIRFDGNKKFVGIKRVIVGVLDNILSHIPERRISIQPDFRELSGEKNKKLAVTVGIMLLVLLFVSIVFGVRQKSISLERSKYDTQLIQAIHELDEAKSLSGLNPARARELLLSSRSKANDLKNQGVKDERLDSLLKDINESIGQIAGIYEIEPELYMDLSILSSGLKGDEIAFSTDRILILDKGGRLVSIDVDTKKTKVVAGPDEVKNASYVAIYADRNFILTDRGIEEIKSGSEVVVDKDWQDAGGVHAYASNIYVLDKESGSIWRYTGSEDGFGPQRNWFAPGIDVNLSGVISWAIDGSIWLLTESGEMERYANGSPQSFIPSGMEGNLSQAVSIFTDEEAQYLYVLDSSNGRIVVLAKDGGFKAEYLSDQIKPSTRIVVSEAAKKIILLQDEKLVAIDARHL